MVVSAGPYTPQPSRKSHKRCMSSSDSQNVPRARTNSIPTAVYSKKPTDNTKFMKVPISTTLHYCKWKQSEPYEP